MYKRLTVIAISMALVFLAGCDLLDTDKDADENNAPITIEMAGKWAGDDSDAGFVGPFVIIMDNTSFSNAYEDAGTVTGVVESFDNDGNYAIVKITDHWVTDFIGKYIKFAWLTEPTSTTSIQSYLDADTIEAAKAETTVLWGPVVLTKI